MADDENWQDEAFRAYDAAVAEMSAAGPIAARRRALFERIIAMDEAGLAAMERAADAVVPAGADYGFSDLGKASEA